MNTLIKRSQRQTPRFFKKVRAIGLSVAAIAASIVAAPVALPAIVVKIAGYLAVAGTVMGGVSQVAVKNEKK
jgi:hypothetical protein